MSENYETFDVVVVGLGPTGIIASHELNKAGVKALLVDKADYIGGAAFAADVNLQNVEGFPPQSDFGERTLGSREKAETLVREAYYIFHEYGLPLKPPNNVDIYSYPVDEPTLKGVVASFRNRLESDGHAQIRLETWMRKIERGRSKRWQLRLEGDGRAYEVESDHIIISTGKLSATWLTQFMDEIGIVYRNNRTLALGFRVEELGENVNPVSAGCENLKIRVWEGVTVTETFCWCKNGGVMAYDFDGAKLLDGEHFYGRPQTNTSFGVITTVTLPEGASNTLTSVAFSRYINALGAGKVLMQRFADFRANCETRAGDIARNRVTPSLTEYRLCNLRSYVPTLAVNGLLKLLEEMNSRHACAITDDALLYAPILERIFPDIELSRTLEANQAGLFLAGDCSGKGVGVAPAFVMGLATAREIISRLR